MTAAYATALAQLAAGVLLGGLAAIGSEPIVAGWALLRASHAWLTLFGAVSLTIFATLVFLVPTVLGARVRASGALAAAFAGLLAGPIVAAAGFALDIGAVVMAGMALTFIGALGQVGYVVDAYRRRGTFVNELGWRRVAVGHLAAGPAWLAAAIAVALAELIGGRPIAGWSIGPIAIPMVAGWMLQELVGSWTHLAPTVTPGDPADHAWQRRWLGFGSRGRLVAWQLGVGLAWVGLATETAPLAAVGGLMLAGSIGLAVALVIAALGRGRY